MHWGVPKQLACAPRPLCSAEEAQRQSQWCDSIAGGDPPPLIGTPSARYCGRIAMASEQPKGIGKHKKVRRMRSGRPHNHEVVAVPLPRMGAHLSRPQHCTLQGEPTALGPRKRFYRARAHANPLSDSLFGDVPAHPDNYDWCVACARRAARALNAPLNTSTPASRPPMPGPCTTQSDAASQARPPQAGQAAQASSQWSDS